MNGSINVTHYPEHNFTIYRGNSGTGKTSLLLGMAAMARSRGKRVLWLSTDYISRHIAVHVEDTMIIRDADALESLLKGSVAPLYDMIVFDDIGRLDVPTDMLSAQCIADFRSRNKRDGQVRLCSLTVRRSL